MTRPVKHDVRIFPRLRRNLSNVFGNNRVLLTLVRDLRVEVLHPVWDDVGDRVFEDLDRQDALD